MKTLIVIIALLFTSTAIAEKKTPYCPIIVDLSTGEYVASKGKFKCFANAKAAEKKGYVRSDAGVPTATPNNNFVFTGTQSKNSSLFAITNTQTQVLITKSKGCYFDLDLRDVNGDLETNILSFPAFNNDTSGSTFIYNTGTYFLDVFSSCSSWSVTVVR